VAGYLRTHNDSKLYCVFNFTGEAAYLTWFAFKQHGKASGQLYDHWQGQYHQVGFDHEYFILEPYGFYLLEPAG
jgi:amylosucrase